MSFDKSDENLKRFQFALRLSKFSWIFSAVPLKLKRGAIASKIHNNTCNM